MASTRATLVSRRILAKEYDDNELSPIKKIWWWNQPIRVTPLLFRPAIPFSIKMHPDFSTNVTFQSKKLSAIVRISFGTYPILSNRIEKQIFLLNKADAQLLSFENTPNKFENWYVENRMHVTSENT